MRNFTQKLTRLKSIPASDLAGWMMVGRSNWYPVLMDGNEVEVDLQCDRLVKS